MSTEKQKRIAERAACLHRWQYGDGVRTCLGCDAAERAVTSPAWTAGGDA